MRIIDPSPQWSPYPVGEARSFVAEVALAQRDLDAQRARVFASYIEHFSAVPESGDHAAREENEHTTRRFRSTVSSVDIALEMGLARTECVREISDGIPIIIGTEESTKPTSAPKGSISYEDLIDPVPGVRW